MSKIPLKRRKLNKESSKKFVPYNVIFLHSFFPIKNPNKQNVRSQREGKRRHQVSVQAYRTHPSLHRQNKKERRRKSRTMGIAMSSSSSSALCIHGNSLFRKLINLVINQCNLSIYVAKLKTHGTKELLMPNNNR